MFPWRKSRRRVLLTELGNRNTGDETLYATAIRRFAAAGWQVSVLYRVRPRDDVLAVAPLDLHELRVEDAFDGVACVADLLRHFEQRHPAGFRATRELVEKHDLVAIAPGGRFTDGYNNPRALLTASVALASGIPLVNLHQSVGPLHVPGHRALVAEVFGAARQNIIRDDLSHAFLRDLGVAEDRLILSRDAAFTEDGDVVPEPVHDVGINIRHGFNGRADPAVLREFLQRLAAARPGSRVLVYSTTHAPDEHVRTAAAGLAEIRTDVPSYRARLQDPGSCRVNITDSFHGMIFSIQAGRPTLCCRTDFSSWKMEGTRAPGVPVTEVLPGFVDPTVIPLLLERTIAALGDPALLLERQGRLLEHARAMADAGWKSLWDALAVPGAGGRKP